jgi:N-sulfoglucosamine sulfohydrolase
MPFCVSDVMKLIIEMQWLMKLSRMIKVLMLFLILALGVTSFGSAADRPNILWITAEDMSPTLGCYGDQYATTPRIDNLSTQSVRYTRAFASAPVCSPSRSCLITGCYAQSLGTQQMRSAFPIPDYMTGFPSHLRKHGYYTSNNVKTDYNTGNWQKIIQASWNESSPTAHWRNRKDKSQPFFSVFNLMTSHQSRTMVWPYSKFQDEVQSKLTAEQVHDPAKAPLPPYYPDTPTIRKTVARFYDCVSLMDKQVGDLLQQLAEDGLAENTIVFFYSDHGSGMPRHKRALLDSGMHVPLLIRFPEKYQEWAPQKAGNTLNRLVSFVDFGPTALSLAGVEVPAWMQGRPFLGKQNARPRKLVYGHRDRVDEVADLARSVRSHRHLYIRNYMPHLGYNQSTAWPDLGEIRHEFYRLTDKSSLTAPQWHFAAPNRAAEELFDCEKDPQNLINLADSPDHQKILEQLRLASNVHIEATRDVGFFAESEAWKLFGGSSAWEASRSGALDLKAACAAATLVGFGSEQQLLENLSSSNPHVRFWGAIGLHSVDSLSEKAVHLLTRSLRDASMAVRIESANVLARKGDVEATLPVLLEALHSDELAVVLHAARSIEGLGDAAVSAAGAMEQLRKRCEAIRPADTPATVVQSGAQDMAMFIGFAVEGFLSRLDDNQTKGENNARGERDGWKSLFDGQTLEAWKSNVQGDVTVVENEIRILSKGKNLWLVHDTDFADFELEVEVKMPAAGYNSGIGFRCTPVPRGYQCEIENDKSGMIYAIGSGWIWPKGAEQSKKFSKMSKGAFKTGEWNKFRIRCLADHIQIWVNDVKTADIKDGRFTKGRVALQHHGKGDVHQFRNVRLRVIE